jgi:hypothetical protein
MPNPIQWIRNVVEAFQFLRTASRKDRSGKVGGFLYSPDDPSIADFYTPEQVFDRRVFISFERGSLLLAERFEVAFRGVGLEPWRYEPLEKERAIEAEYSLELEEMKTKYRETVSRLVATVRRCPAVFFLVSEQSQRSPYCQMEAYAASIVHGFWPESRVRNEAGVYVVLEKTGVSPLPTLDKFWSRIYENGLEEDLAVLIAREMDRLAEILLVVETHRAKVYR